MLAFDRRILTPRGRGANRLFVVHHVDPVQKELALLRAAQASQETYRTLFLLDQLRWCGKDDQAAAVRRLGETTKDAAVKAFAAMVARELDAAAKR